MNALLVDATQGSPEWHGVRIGRVTASVMGSVRAARTHEDRQVLAETICGLREPEFTEHDRERMWVGSEYESVVRDYYAQSLGMRIRETGFWILREYPVIGGSPDGVLENGDVIEIKITEHDTPQTYTDNYSELPYSHFLQSQTNAFALNALNCHYVSYSRTSGRIYTRIVPFDSNRFTDEALGPALEFHGEYVQPLIDEWGLLDPVLDYERRLKSIIE
jgi:hypothetical protein